MPTVNRSSFGASDQLTWLRSSLPKQTKWARSQRSTETQEGHQNARSVPCGVGGETQALADWRHIPENVGATAEAALQPKSGMSQHESETIVSKQRTHLATTEQGVDAREGPSRKRSDDEARRARGVRTGLEARWMVFAWTTTSHSDNPSEQSQERQSTAGRLIQSAPSKLSRIGNESEAALATPRCWWWWPPRLR